MVRLFTFGTATVEGEEETTVEVEYLPRAEAEDLVVAGRGAASIRDYADPNLTNEEERVACEMGIATSTNP